MVEMERTIILIYLLLLKLELILAEFIGLPEALVALVLLLMPLVVRVVVVKEGNILTLRVMG
jgi:hypothetical protein